MITTILICGSRNWVDEDSIANILSTYSPESTVIVHGAARGADRIAGKVALRMGFEVREYPAQWEQYGKAAGVIRNQKMLDEENPDKVYAFRVSGMSRGTDDMIRRSRKAGVPVQVISDVAVGLEDSGKSKEAYGAP